MKNIIINIFNKYKKIIILLIIGLVLILVGSISWNVYFSKVKMFKENEKKFYETVKNYYDFHKQKLPRKNESRTLTLQDLYSKDLIDDLYIPKTSKTCDVNLSRVRVYQDDNGEYIYNTYLKCGRFESHIDHNGPEITLNGKDTIVLAINSEYKELGIKEVKDDKDGKLDISKVVIDTSELKVNKTGNYKVTYTAYDSSYNKTVVERKVYVRANLTEEVNKNTDTTGYYKGAANNNYLLFSGMLFRIVNVNNDGTIKIVADQNISNTVYGNNSQDYKNSNVKEWLNKMFYKNLHNTKDYVVEDSKWCLDEACTNTVTDKIGLLTLNDYKNSFEDYMSYLQSFTGYYLLTNENSNVYSVDSFLGLKAVEPTTISGIKPVLVLKENLYVMSGDGTLDKPYKLGDYSYAKKDDLLNTRLVGEYVNYSGMMFRISGFDKDKNIKLTSVDYLKNINDGNNFVLAYTNEDKKMIFNPKQSGNIGYELNNNLIDYIDESLIVKHDYTVYKYDPTKKYNEYEKKNNFNSKLSIPATFDLFSGTDNSLTLFARYWLIDYIDDNHAFMINGLNGRTFEITDGEYDKNALRIVLYVKKDVKIKKGRGTVINPFYIK